MCIELKIKALANKDTLLRTHCCGHKCFPDCPRAIFVADTNFVSGTHKNVSDFVQRHFVSATNVSQFAQPKKHHRQQCVHNNVSSFTRALTSSVPCYSSNQRVHCSLSLPNEPTSSPAEPVFIRPTYLSNA